MEAKNYKRVNHCAIINTDYEAFEAYKRRKNKMREMENRINSIEDKLNQILELLQEKINDHSNC